MRGAVATAAATPTTWIQTRTTRVKGIKAAKKKKSAFVRRAGHGKSQDFEWWIAMGSSGVSRGKSWKNQKTPKVEKIPKQLSAGQSPSSSVLRPSQRVRVVDRKNFPSKLRPRDWKFQCSRKRADSAMNDKQRQFSSVQFGSVRFSSVCQEFSFTSRCQLFSIPVFGDWLWSRGQEVVAAGRVAYSTLLRVRGSVSSAASKEKRLSKDLFIPSPTIFVVIFGLCVVRFSFAALLPAFCLPGKLCLFAFGHT